MATKLLLIGASLRKDYTSIPIPALNRYIGERWKVLQETLPTVIHRPRIVVISPKYGFISLAQPIGYYTDEWHGNNWKAQLPQLQNQYNRVVRPAIDPGTDIFVSANAPHKTVLNACGFQQDVVDRKASIRTAPTLKALENEALRAWLQEGGIQDGTQGTLRPL